MATSSDSSTAGIKLEPNKDTGQGSDIQQTVVKGHTFSVPNRYNFAGSKVLGLGCYGVVTNAKDTETNTSVAIKRVRPYDEDVDYARRVLSEIRCLKVLRNHPNIISLANLTLFEQKKELYMVMEEMDSDLGRIIDSKQTLTEEHFSCFTSQILQGVKAMHDVGIFHRDLKPGNILISKDCKIKITDFGLARHMDELTLQGKNIVNPANELVVTQCYRCPELLIAPTKPYTSAIDMWSVGCIIGEFYNRKPLFHCGKALPQLKFMLSVVGFNAVEEFGIEDLDDNSVDNLRKLICQGTGLAKLIPSAPLKALDLIASLLSVNPKKRPTASDALNHIYVKPGTAYLTCSPSSSRSAAVSASPYFGETDTSTSSSISSVRSAWSNSILTKAESDIDRYFLFECQAFSLNRLVELIKEEVAAGPNRSDMNAVMGRKIIQESVASLGKDACNSSSSSTGLVPAKPSNTADSHNADGNCVSRKDNRKWNKLLCFRCGENGHDSHSCLIKGSLVVIKKARGTLYHQGGNDSGGFGGHDRRKQEKNKKKERCPELAAPRNRARNAMKLSNYFAVLGSEENDLSSAATDSDRSDSSDSSDMDTETTTRPSKRRSYAAVAASTATATATATATCDYGEVDPVRMDVCNESCIHWDEDACADQFGLCCAIELTAAESIGL